MSTLLENPFKFGHTFLRNFGFVLVGFAEMCRIVVVKAGPDFAQDALVCLHFVLQP